MTKRVCDKVVCQRVCVTKLRVTKLCVKDCVCVTKLWVTKRGAPGFNRAQARQRRRRWRDTESKTRTPHKDVGNKKTKQNKNRMFCIAKISWWGDDLVPASSFRTQTEVVHFKWRNFCMDS